MRIDSDCICTLIVEDQNSGKPLILPFRESPQIALVSAPTTMKLFNVKDIEEMRASDPEKYRLYTDEWDSGTFTAQEVNRQRQKAVILHKSLRQAVNQGRSLPVGAEQLFRRLGAANRASPAGNRRGSRFSRSSRVPGNDQRLQRACSKPS
jgi:hypothetical protein